MSIKRICAFFLVFLVTASLSVCAGQGISAGPLRIKPSIELSATSDSNVLLLPKDAEQDDTYFSIFPRVIVAVPDYHGHTFRLDYAFEVRRYSDLESEDADLSNLDFYGLLNVSSQFRVRVLERFRQLSGDTEEILGRVEYSRNHAEVAGTYDVNSKISVEGRYTNLNHDYEDPLLIGRTEDQYGGAVMYNLYDKWGVLVEVTHGEIDIDDTTADASYNRVLFGARGSFTPKLTGKVKFGFEKREYDGDREETDVGYISGEITHEVASDMSFQISATRELIESITYEGTSYTLTQGRARLTKDFADRIRVILSAYYQTSNYEEPILRGGALEEREDDIWQAEIDVEYKVNRWARVIAGIEHKNTDSSFDENDYEYNRFKLGARLEY